ncbi:nucleolin-like [Helianthus annuus]|uniref:nucleolin-like n=1 Tax=Helianthus annuus TaxID=4232 RepID=UPI000B904343|nr:nucleolin-like [Helianthus annuus]
MDSEDEIAYFYYESRQFSPKKNEEEPVLKEKASEKASEKVSERAPVFDHSSDEESDDDSEEIRKLEFYTRKISSDNDNLCFAGKTEKIKEKQAVKKKNHKAATVKEKDDSDDDNSQVKKQDDSDDEDVRVLKKQVKEIPAFKVEKEADAEKIPEKCENCDTVKRIYPTVEGMKAFEEEDIEVKDIGNFKQRKVSGVCAFVFAIY